jgi:hypothetical protein
VFGASLSRWFAQPLRKLGLSAIVAPAHPVTFKATGRPPPGRISLNPLRLYSFVLGSSGGIAGGGLFEFDKTTALKVLPLALIYVGRVLLSNISFA